MMGNLSEIQPSVISQEIACAELPAPPNAMVVFGASGDLVRRKLIVSLAEIFKQGLIGKHFYLLGCGRTTLTDRQFRQIAQQPPAGSGVKEHADRMSQTEVAPFFDRLYYISGDYDSPSFYNNIKSRLSQLNKKHDVDGGTIFYLAVPPLLYGTIALQLGSAGLCGLEQEKTPALRSATQARVAERQQVKLVVEKPFGRDLQSAVQLNSVIGQCFDESQIYRIDHYLGKETVQNILMFRFANTIFEPVWNRNYIDSVQLTIAETLGVEHRAGYYDEMGALRDMFQNHILQMLALVAMEPPISFEAESIRDEKVKLLRSVRPFKLDELDKNIIRGQYSPGQINGKKVAGYRAEPGVNPKSRTETYFAARLFVDNWRWKGVPFYLRAGKRLAARDTEIAITFKNVPHSMFVSAGQEKIAPNVLVLQIQPEEGISLSFQAKRPGSKLCMGTLNMSFSYQSIFGISLPDAYQRLLLDCMNGDKTLFIRFDNVEAAWQLLTPVLQAWQETEGPPHEYAAGSSSFAAANALIESDGRNWRPLAGL